MYIDTHAHLLDHRYDQDRDQLIQSLPEKGVGRMIECAADICTSKGAAKLCQEYDHVYATVGIHPHSAKDWDDSYENTLRELAEVDKVVAVGEIGLDYHYDNSPRDIQQKVFRKQMQLASELKLPVAIHSRDATLDTLTVLREFEHVIGVMHSFSGSLETMEIALELGYYISFAGMITFKNAKRPQQVAAAVPLERVLIETDSPYMTPTPHRGKRNTPEYVRYVAEQLATLKNMTLNEIKEATTRNAMDLFSL